MKKSTRPKIKLINKSRSATQKPIPKSKLMWAVFLLVISFAILVLMVIKVNNRELSFVVPSCVSAAYGSQHYPQVIPPELEQCGKDAESKRQLEELAADTATNPYVVCGNPDKPANRKKQQALRNTMSLGLSQGLHCQPAVTWTGSESCLDSSGSCCLRGPAWSTEPFCETIPGWKPGMKVKIISN